MTQIFVIENGIHGYYAEVVDSPNSDREYVLHATECYPTRGEALAAADAWEADYCDPEPCCENCGVVCSEPHQASSYEGECLCRPCGEARVLALTCEGCGASLPHLDRWLCDQCEAECRAECNVVDGNIDHIPW